MFQDWTDPAWARRWSAQTDRVNPTRAEQLDLLLALIDDAFQPGMTILDLGCGSGIVEQMIFDRVESAQIVGIDSSPAMLALAAERLAAYPFRFIAVQHDLRDLAALLQPGTALPSQYYQIAFAVQALHHLTHDEMPNAYFAINRLLKRDGLFFLVDRVAIDAESLYPQYQAVWRRLDALAGAGQAEHEGATFAQHQADTAARGDLPATVEQHLGWLRDTGFEPAPLYVHGNRALIAARKL